MRAKKHTLLFALLMAVLSDALCSSGKLNASQWTPRAKFLGRLEAKLILPERARPLRDYKRFYAGLIIGGHRYVKAVLVYEVHDKGISIVPADKLPQIFDGGCDVIEVLYSVQSREFEKVLCNGSA